MRFLNEATRNPPSAKFWAATRFASWSKWKQPHDRWPKNTQPHNGHDKGDDRREDFEIPRAAARRRRQFWFFCNKRRWSNRHAGPGEETGDNRRDKDTHELRSSIASSCHSESAGTRNIRS